MIDSEDRNTLLGAALVGVVVGAAASMMIYRGTRQPTGIEGVRSRATKSARRGARWARKHGSEGMDWVREKGQDAVGSADIDGIREQVMAYADQARERIGEIAESEVRGLQREIRRRAKRFGR